MRSRFALLASTCGLIAGCAGLPGQEEQSPAPWVHAGVPQPGTSAESLLLYYQHVRKMPVADQAKEHEAARQTYARSRADPNRVRLAMMLSIPGTGFGDDARALELLEPVSKNANGQLQGLAYLLTTQLQERRRLDANAQSLQQKLDALKTLERSLLERKR